MDKKLIQEQRMRGYFIQATKEIIKGEGFKALSVRNIADRAGYSYATMYNYFKDVKELVFECVMDFQEECSIFVDAEVNGVPPGAARIKALLTAYIKFFSEYPGVYDLFFLEKTHEIQGKQPTIEMIYSFPARLCAKDWKYLIDQGVLTQEEAQHKQECLTYLATGLMLFYLNRRIPDDYKAFLQRVQNQFNQILEPGI